MNLEIRKVKENDLKRIFTFRSSYINMSFEDFTKNYLENADYWFVVYDENILLGYCLGKKGKKIETYMEIVEIATNVNKSDKYIRKGIGTRLIKLFEEEVWKHGFKTIGLGSGENHKTEQFYLKNDYTPIEIVAKNNDVDYKRVKINSYEEGKYLQREFNQKYDVEEVIFIFEKYANGVNK